MKLVTRGSSEFIEWYASGSGAPGNIPLRFLTQEGKRLRELLKEKIGRMPKWYNASPESVYFKWKLEPGEDVADFYILRDWLADQGYPMGEVKESVPNSGEKAALARVKKFSQYYPDPEAEREEIRERARRFEKENTVRYVKIIFPDPPTKQEATDLAEERAKLKKKRAEYKRIHGRFTC